MDSVTKSCLLKSLQKEFVRRNIIKYFEMKGYDNFLVKPYPPSIIDIADSTGILDGLIEIKYYLEDINMNNNILKIGWNLFVLGSQRAFLGYTTHKNFSEIENGISNVKNEPNCPISIKELVEWIVEVIGSSNKLKEVYEQYSDNNKNNYSRPQFNSYNRAKSIPNFNKRV